MHDYAMITLHRDGPLAVVTLNRPDRLNAAPPAMFDELRHALGRIADDAEHGSGDANGSDDARPRALLLTGAGSGFCAGADILAAPTDTGRSGDGAGDAPLSMGARAAHALTEHYNPALADLVALPVPSVAAVRGAAAGIGCSLALSCDFVVAGESAYFLQAFVRLGLVPDGGANWLLPRLVGVARATEMLMLGERVEARRAAEWGLIHRAVADDVLDDAARALALRLAQGPTQALAAMRALRRTALESSHAATLAAEADAQRRAAETEDAREGIAAFVTRRPPVFSGR